MDFEKPIIDLERKIEELKSLATKQKLDFSGEIRRLEERLQQLKLTVYRSLTPWQRVQIARHPKRPYALDYVNVLMTGFVEMHGDRLFADDKALIGGPAQFEGRKVMVIGHQKGRDTKENLYRNFGSAHPEGYRKALRLMQMAEKFRLPIVVFVDTPGAYPGIGAEERGQAHAIAFNLREMTLIAVPIVVIVIGEGGSGGALGIGVGDRICVLQNAYYSVISPEGCAAILWRDRTRAQEAADALKLTAEDLLEKGIIDEVIEEPLGGAHRDPAQMAEAIRMSLRRHLDDLLALSVEALLEQRYEKYRRIGVFEQQQIAAVTDGAQEQEAA